MNPNYVHTVTVYHYAENEWLRSVFRNCFWKSGIVVLQSGINAEQRNTYTVRIPLEEVTEFFSVSDGDIVVLGECPEEITGKSPNTAAELLRRRKPDAFRVTAYADNTAHRLGKHYRLGG